MYEYCRKLVVEEKIPLKTVFEALEGGATIAKIVSQYLPAGVGRQKLMEILQYFEKKKVIEICTPNLILIPYQLVHIAEDKIVPEGQWKKYGIYMSGLASEKGTPIKALQFNFG